MIDLIDTEEVSVVLRKLTKLYIYKLLKDNGYSVPKEICLYWDYYDEEFAREDNMVLLNVLFDDVDEVMFYEKEDFLTYIKEEIKNITNEDIENIVEEIGDCFEETSVSVTKIKDSLLEKIYELYKENEKVSAVLNKSFNDITYEMNFSGYPSCYYYNGDLYVFLSYYDVDVELVKDCMHLKKVIKNFLDKGGEYDTNAT